jgi:hypothetical protein
LCGFKFFFELSPLRWGKGGLAELHEGAYKVSGASHF